ncbi:hypothetical protein D3C77_603870 [compost metagenome]
MIGLADELLNLALSTLAIQLQGIDGALADESSLGFDQRLQTTADIDFATSDCSVESVQTLDRDLILLLIQSVHSRLNITAKFSGHPCNNCLLFNRCEELSERVLEFREAGAVQQVLLVLKFCLERRAGVYLDDRDVIQHSLIASF